MNPFERNANLGECYVLKKETLQRAKLVSLYECQQVTLLRSYFSHRVLRGFYAPPMLRPMPRLHHLRRYMPLGSLKAETDRKLGIRCRLWPVWSLREVRSLSHVEKRIDGVQLKGASGMWLELSLG